MEVPIAQTEGGAVMSEVRTMLEANAQYDERFTKDDLPMPPPAASSS